MQIPKLQNHVVSQIVSQFLFSTPIVLQHAFLPLMIDLISYIGQRETAQKGC